MTAVCRQTPERQRQGLVMVGDEVVGWWLGHLPRPLANAMSYCVGRREIIRAEAFHDTPVPRIVFSERGHIDQVNAFVLSCGEPALIEIAPAEDQ